MARLLRALEPESTYFDKQFDGTWEEYTQALRESTTVYVGNLAYVTKEEQIYAFFSNVAPVKNVIMGLDRNAKTPCGFCFVQFYSRDDTECAVKYLSGSTLDDRDIRIDFDWGFREGRQYGRGKSGAQVRDELREYFDEGRGGYGFAVARTATVPGKRARHNTSHSSDATAAVASKVPRNTAP